MKEINEFLQQLRTHRPVEWSQLPDFALYMDQVLSYMDRQVIRLEGDDGLTAAMVNNYTKSSLVPRAEGKKYGREHLAYLTAISILKRVMSAKDMDFLIREELSSAPSLEERYAAFCESLDSALVSTADEMVPYVDNADLADAAIHFALISYAASLASNQFVSLLRQQKGHTDTKGKKKGKDREE